ncbi:FxSxx-COOH system tetratricopeptide repeat protein [Streptomyces sp. NBC_00203]
MPPRNPAFTGRGLLLRALHVKLHRAVRPDNGSSSTDLQVSLVSLVGIGGIGKTQVVLEYAHRHANRYAVVWWLDADQPTTLSQGLMDLACHLGRPNSTPAEAVQALRVELSARSDWLLVYDNVDDLETLHGLLATTGGGHILITGRDPRLARFGAQVDIGDFTRAESRQLLLTRCPSLASEEADQVAAAVGDLPLAVEQAGCFLQDTGLSTDEYLDFLDTHPGQAGMDDPTVAEHPGLAAAVAATRARLAAEDPHVLNLFNQLAFLAPEPIPLGSQPVSDRPGRFGVLLGNSATTALAVRRLVGLGLARHANHTLQLHRLVQALLRTHLPQTEQSSTVHSAQNLLATSAPGDPDDPHSWPNYSQLTPHAQTLTEHSTKHIDTLETPRFRDLCCNTLRYLYTSGQYQAAHDLADRIRTRWDQTLGADHPDALRSAHTLAVSLYKLGKHEQARELDQQTLDARHRVLGPDHPDTLRSANNLAVGLNFADKYEQARELNQQTLDARHRVLGPDHPDTLGSANNLAADLRGLDEYEQARELDHQTLDARRRALGPDHPDTLTSAYNLAADLRGLDEYEQARELDHQTLDARRRILGPDHPDTLTSAYNLAADLRGLDEYEQARELDHQTLDARRRILGPDHPDTLTSAYNLGIDLYALGEYEQASELGRQTLDARRRILGPDHPDTLTSANNLAVDLRALGEYEQASELGRQTLDARRRILGPDHPDTLRSANNLAVDLRALGEYEQAAELDH